MTAERAATELDAPVRIAEAAATGDKISAQRNRICLYTMNYTPELTGIGRYSGEIGAYLAENDLDVDVVTTPAHYPGWTLRDGHANRYAVERRGRERITRCPLVLRSRMSGLWRLLAPLSFAVSSAPVVFWRIISLRPAIVLCVEPTLIAAPAALLAAKLVGARAILHVQDLEIDAAFAVGHLNANWLKKAAFVVERGILRGFDTVVTISDQMRAKLAEKGVAGERLKVVRNWVNLSKITPQTGPNGFRKELGLSDGQFVVLYAGNLGIKQALPLIADAAERLVGRPDITFVVAGDGPAKAALVARALPNMRFLPLQPEVRLCELLSLADVHILPQDPHTADLVLPSKLGGMLASGRPLIVMADAGTELQQFLAGVSAVVPAGDVDGVVSALEAMTVSTERAADGRKARELSQALSHHIQLQLFMDILAPKAKVKSS